MSSFRQYTPALWPHMTMLQNVAGEISIESEPSRFLWTMFSKDANMYKQKVTIWVNINVYFFLKEKIQFFFFSHHKLVFCVFIEGHCSLFSKDAYVRAELSFFVSTQCSTLAGGPIDQDLMIQLCLSLNGDEVFSFKNKNPIFH